MHIRQVSKKWYVGAAILLFVVVLLVGLQAHRSSTNQPQVAASEKQDSSSVKTPAEAPAPAGVTAGDVLNLSNWKLTLPIKTNQTGNPDEILQPQLSHFTLDPYFQVNDAEDGIIFQAPVNGVTTKGSHYPRSELREMTTNGRQEASWSNTQGNHTMTIKQAITHLPVVKPELVAGQIHDSSDDIVMIRLEGSRLFVEANGKDIGALNPSYALGTVFTVKIAAAAGHIKVYYNDLLAVDYAKSGSGLYFKAGCYTQSNTTKGDAATAYGQVVIYDLKVAHNP